MLTLDFLYQDNITMFIRSIEDGEIVWYPKILKNVHAVMNHSKTQARYGEGNGSSASINILYSGDRSSPMIGDYLYVLPKAWSALSETKKPYAITFQYGENFDFWYVGEWDGTNKILDSDYPSGFYHYMNREYDDVYAIDSCSQYYYIPHFSITAK